MRISTKITRESRIPLIRKKIATAKSRILFRQAGYLRKVARNKISKGKRPRKKDKRKGSARLGVEISAPGAAPMYHSNRGIKRTISFAVDRARGVAVIGYERGTNPAIPKALERGGTTSGSYGPQRVRARPLMRPSLRSSRATFKKIVKDEFTKIWR